jgi:hypothetical protein
MTVDCLVVQLALKLVGLNINFYKKLTQIKK